MKKAASLCSLLLTTIALNAQNIHGIITDKQKATVPNAVLILQNVDSSFVNATTTDSLGKFNLDITINKGWVVVQHLAYESKTIVFANGDFSALKNITLTEKTTQLDGITISAETPPMIVKDNALVYNAHHINEKKAVSNAFELLKYTPGITTRNDEISLAGASQLTIIIDGKATTLSNGEITDVLKAMPASNIGNIEVMYKAPAKYGVKGALINIVTDKKRRNTPFEAELATEYTQQFYTSGRSRANVAYRGEKLDFDVLGNTSYGKIREKFSENAINNFNGIQTIIDQQSNVAAKYNGNTLRTSVDYNFNEENTLSLLYYVKENKLDSDMKSDADFRYHTGKSNLINSSNNKNDKNILHNVNFKGVFGGASITADYVSYYDNTKTKYKDFESDSITTDYHYNSAMDIDQLKLLASYDWEISESWQMSAGAQSTMTNSDTEMSYLYPQNGIYELDKSSYGNNKQKERRFSVFAETSNTIRDSIQLSLTLELEYFKSDYDENGTKSTLWNDWMVYPSLSVMWPLKRDIIQFFISTYKEYPTYWNLSPYVTQVNPYTFEIGNPLLKPATYYDFNLAYIFNKQYTINAYTYFMKDYFADLPYQNAEEMRNYNQTVNFDYSLSCGVNCEFPFCIGFWEPTLSGCLFYNRNKMSDFHNLSFDRNKFIFSVSAQNTFAVSEKPNLKFTLDAEYVSKGIQGIYDINDAYNLEIGVKWSILQNLIFTAKWSDIFERWNGFPVTTNFNGQYLRWDQKSFNSFNASLVWRIGGFKAKEVEMTDTQRMQR